MYYEHRMNDLFKYHNSLTVDIVHTNMVHMCVAMLIILFLSLAMHYAQKLPDNWLAVTLDCYCHSSV